MYFHGDGGNGKSLLLKFLREKCYKRLPQATWRQLKTKSDAEVAAYIQQETWDYTPVPVVLHDFGQQTPGHDRPQDPFYGLLMLRRNLSNVAAELDYRLRFPLYDFGCVWYLYKTGKLEQVKELLPAAELDLISTIVDVVSQTPGGTISKAILGIFSKHLGQQFNLYLQQRG